MNRSVVWHAEISPQTSSHLHIISLKHCEFKFGSWTFNGLQLDIQLESPIGDASKFLTNGEWELVAFPAQRTVQYYVCCPEPYPDVRYTLILRRRTLYYHFNMIVPSLLLTCKYCNNCLSCNCHHSRSRISLNLQRWKHERHWRINYSKKDIYCLYPCQHLLLVFQLWACSHLFYPPIVEREWLWL